MAGQGAIVDDHNIDNRIEGAQPVDQSGRRDFIKKMVIAGAIAAPVVATFARGVRGTKSLQTALDENVATNSLDAQLLNSRTEAHFQNAASTRPPITTSNTTIAKSPTTTNAPTTTNSPSTTAKACTTSASNTTLAPRK